MKPLRSAALAAALCASPLVAPLASAQDAQADRDVGFIQGLIEDNLSSDSVVVRIEGFEGALSSRASVGTLTVADSEGVWLRATGLTLDWTRSALLTGRLEVSEMSAETIEFIRSPIADTSLPAPEAEPYVFALPTLPVSVNIEEIRADRIVIGEAFLGTQYAFSVDGAVSLDGGEGQVGIVAQRLDATVGSFAITGAYSNTTQILALTLDLQEEANGIVARALDIPDRPAVRLLLDGEAPIDDYAATLSIATDGAERISGEFGLVTVRETETAAPAQDLRLDISGDLTALVDPEFAEFFGTNSRIAVQGGRAPDGAISLRALDIETGSVSLTGSAEIAPEGWPRTLDIAGHIASPDGTPVLLPGGGARTYISDLTLDVTFDASAGDAWRGAFILNGLSTPSVTIPVLTLNGSGEIVPERDTAPGRFSADLTYGADAIAFTDAALAEAIGASVSGQISVARVSDGPFEIDTLTLTGPGLDMAASGTVQGPANGFEAGLTMLLTAGDLTRFGALTGLDVGGGANLSLDATLRPLDGTFDAAIMGQTDGLRLGIAQLDPLLAGQGDIVLAAARDTAGTRIDVLTVTTDEVRLGGTADLRNTGLTANFSLDVANLGRALPGLDGPATITGTANTGTDGITAVAANAALPGTAVTITVSLPPAASPAPIAVDIAADIANIAPFAPLAGRDLAGAVMLTLTGTTARDGATFDLALSGDSTDLAVGVAQLDPFLTGAATIAADLHRTGPLSLTVNGLSLTTPNVTLTADVQATDGVGTADFSLDITDIAPALPELSGALSLAGQIARDSAGAVSADVTGRGPGAALVDLTGTLDAAFALDADIALTVADLAPYATLAGMPLAGAADLTATVRATNAYQPETTVFDLRFDGALENIVAGPRRLLGRIGANGTLSRDIGGTIDAAVHGGGPGGVSLSVDGTMAPLSTGGELSGMASLHVEDLAPIAAFIGTDMTGGFDIDLSGRLLPSGETFDLRFDTAAGDVSAFGYTLPFLHSARGAVSRASDGAIAINATARAFATDTIEPTGRGTLDMAINGTMAADAARNGLDGSVALRVDDLAIYSNLAAALAPGLGLQDLAGALDLSASGTALPDASLFDVTFDLAGRDLAAAGYGLVGAVTATGAAARDATGALTADISATGPGGLAATIDGTMAAAAAGSDLAGRLTVRATDLSVYSALAGQPFAGSLELTASGTARPDASLFDVRFDLSGRDLAGVGYGLDGALTAQGTASRTVDGLTSVDANMTGPGSAAVTVDATLASAADGGQIRGTLAAAVADLSPYSGLAGRRLAGRLDADLAGMAWPDLSGFDITFDLDGADLAAGGIALPGGLTANGQGLRESGGATAITLDATGPGGATVKLAATGAETVTVDLTASVDSLSTYAGLIGQPLAGGVTAQVNGTTALDFATFDFALDAQTRSLDVGVAAARPLLAGLGRVNGQISRTANGTLRAADLDIAFPAFTVTGNFDSANGAGGATFAARLNDVGQFTGTLSGPATATGSARLQPSGGVRLDIDATGPGGISASVLGTVGPGSALALNINGQAPLALANPFIVPRTLDGQASFALSVNGPPALSSVSGTVTLANGRLFAPLVGQTLTDLGGTVQLTGGQAILGLGAGLDSGGRLTVTGPVGLAAPFNADIRITAEALVIRDPNLFETTANGAITLRGPLTGGAQIGGAIDIGETEIQVPSSSLSTLGALPEVRHIGASPAVRTTLNRAGLTVAGVEVGADTGGGGGGAAYPIDLVIRAPNRIFIRGRGVDAELGGQLQITGTTAQLIPQGQFELIRGRIDILQQRFDLTEGGAYLQGDFVPYIRLVAVTEATDGTVVSVIVDGPADDPEVRFESQPDLPQDEVLARLLFGRDLSSISPLQAVQLASAVSTLAGSGGGGLIDDFRAGIGLDDLDIVTDDSGGVAVRAGAYLAENIYTDVVVGTDTTEITLNLDLTDDITVTGKTGSDGDSSIGIYFERDY